MLTSDQLRVFLAVARGGSTIAAARHLRLDHSTVSRRLTSLEQELATRLFDRSPRGLAPTPAALALVAGAEQVESALLAAADSIAQRDADVSGTVRLATPEMFGTHLVAPHLKAFADQHPRLTIELAPESRSISLSKREADLAVMLSRPPRGRLVVRRLVDYRLGLYASRAYLDAGPPLTGLDQLARHRFVSYIDELAAIPELVALDDVQPNATVAFRSSSSAAQQAAVVAGVGLGMLHVYTAGRDPRLIRVLPDEIETRRSYWLVVQADLQRTPRVRATIAFIERCVVESRPML